MSGFTLIEVIVAVATLAGLFVLALPVAIDFYQNQLLASERDNLVGILRRARTLALVNKGGSAHGVFIGPDENIIFEGASYAARNAAEDETFSRSNAVTITGPSELVFAALSGDSSSSTLTLKVEQRTATISINSEGSILWQ